MSQSVTEFSSGTRTATSACPYCSLLCDDLTLNARADGAFDIAANGCRRALQDFARIPLTAEARVAGRVVPLDKAIASAARLLKQSRQPLIGGLATDVDGIRAAVDLAERCGASLDHVHGDTLSAMSRVLQTRGWFTTTLSEVRNRADVIVMIGLDLEARHENFLRRCAFPEHMLDETIAASRRVFYLGSKPPQGDARIAPLRVRDGALGEVLQVLPALLKGARVDATRIGGLPRAALVELAATLRGARYAALVFAPGALGAPAEPALASLFECIDVLNRETRAAALPLGGDDGGQTAMSTCAWLTGYPLRIHCGNTVSYDPVGLSTRHLLARGTTDTLLWIDAFGRHGTPPAGSPAERTIVLASTPDAATSAAVYIAVGTPGIDHDARLVRTDAVVSVALKAQRATTLPSVAGVLAAITARL